MHIRGLDGIRAVAALSVVITHLNGWVALHELGWLPESAVPLVSGSTGVQAFFVLSGFLITTLLIQEHDATGEISIRKFFVRRVLRIFPLYYLFLVFASLLYLLDSRVTSPTSLAFGYLYIYNFIPVSAYTSFMGHTWSLAVEEHFYLLWPLVFLLTYPARRNLTLTILGAWILGSLFLHVLLVKAGMLSGYFVSRWTFIAGYSIAAGCLLAMLMHSEVASPRLRTELSRSVVLVIALVVFVGPAFLFGRSWLFDHVVSSYFRCVGIVLAIAWTVCNQQSRLVRALEMAPLSYLGKVSYGIYMYQGLFLATGPHREPGHLWPLAPAWGACLLLIVTPISYHYFERPFLRLKGRFEVIRQTRKQIQ